MSELSSSLQPPKAQTQKPDKKTIREAILRLRQLGAESPPSDAVEIVRSIRQGEMRTSV